MKIDVDIDKFTGGYKIIFPISEFKEKSDYKMGIQIIRCFSNDMELDPELEVEDMQDILDKTVQAVIRGFPANDERLAQIVFVEHGRFGVGIDHESQPFFGHAWRHFGGVVHRRPKLRGAR